MHLQFSQQELRTTNLDGANTSVLKVTVTNVVHPVTMDVLQDVNQS